MKSTASEPGLTIVSTTLLSWLNHVKFYEISTITYTKQHVLVNFQLPVDAHF